MDAVKLAVAHPASDPAAIIKEIAQEELMRTLHLAQYVAPIAVPLLLISAVVGRKLDKILEHPERTRTALFIATVAASLTVALGTLAVSHWWP